MWLYMYYRGPNKITQKQAFVFLELTIFLINSEPPQSFLRLNLDQDTSNYGLWQTIFLKRPFELVMVVMNLWSCLLGLPIPQPSLWI